MTGTISYRVFRILLSGASLGAALFARDASALINDDPTDPGGGGVIVAPPPTCAEPTVAQCQDATYLESTCGGAKRDVCGQKLGPAFKDASRALATKDSVLVDQGSSQVVRQTNAFAPLPMPARKDTLGTVSYRTAAQLSRLPVTVSSSASTAPQHPAWEANGSAIASCEEYAYEHTYDFSRFAEAADTCGKNLECIYQLAQLTETPGISHQLDNKHGTKLAWQAVPSGKLLMFMLFAKNGFFARSADFLKTMPAYASNAAFRAKADAILAHMNGTAKYTAPSAFAWHRNMHDAYTPLSISNAEKLNIKQRLAAYEGASFAWERADQVVQMLESGPSWLDVFGNLTDVYRDARDAAAEARKNALFAEWDHKSLADGTTPDKGCLSRTTVKCDWSPDQFVDAYVDAMETDRETLFQQCIDVTGNDLSSVPAGAKADSDALNVWLEARSLPKLAEGQIGQRVNDSEQWGDTSWFAAGYDYDAGWRLQGERQASTGRICKLKGKAWATAHANAWALTKKISVVDTDTYLSAREEGNLIKWHSHLRVVGDDVYDPVNGSFTQRSATPYHKEYDKTLATKTYTKWFSVAGIQVKLQAKTELKGGAVVDLKAEAAEGCNPDNLAYDASASAKPWVKVHVTPEISVGIGLVQGGVRGDVDLIAASVLASAGAKLIGDPTHLDDVVFKIDMGADLVVDALDGKLSVFLEACFLGCTDIASKEIYNWKGYHWEIPIFNYQKDLRFQVFDSATSPGALPVGGALPVFEAASMTARVAP